MTTTDHNPDRYVPDLYIHGGIEVRLTDAFSIHRLNIHVDDEGTVRDVRYG